MIKEFISIKTMGLSEDYFGEPTVDKACGETKYVCPICGSHDIIIKNDKYICACNNCGYYNIAKPIILDKLIDIVKSKNIYHFSSLDEIHNNAGIEFSVDYWFIDDVKKTFNLNIYGGEFSFNILTDRIYNQLINKL